MADSNVRVEGYRQFLRACDLAGKETRREVRSTLREVGEVVRVPWRGDLNRYGQRTATGLRTIVRQRGVTVEQTRRKTTVESRRRPNFTRIQQTLGDAVLAQEQGRIVGEFNNAIDRVADYFERQ